MLAPPPLLSGNLARFGAVENYVSCARRRWGELIPPPLNTSPFCTLIGRRHPICEVEWHPWHLGLHATLFDIFLSMREGNFDAVKNISTHQPR